MKMRSAGAVTVAMLWMIAPGVAGAQTASFPAVLEREALLVWMQRETDILPDQVVAVTPQALTAIVSRFPAGAGAGPRLVIRAEALSSELQSRTGALSWHVSLNADCRNGLVKLGETTGYSERNLLGERRVLRAAESAWRKAEPGTAVEHAWRAACEPGFAGPFKSSAVRLARAESPSPPTAPAPEAETPPPPATSAAGGVATVARATPRPAAARPAAAKTSPSSAKPSGPVAQLGALTSDAAARAMLAASRGRLDGRSTWIEKADVAGRTWHRVMAGGFADAGEANRFCSGLKAAGQSCFVRSGS